MHVWDNFTVVLYKYLILKWIIFSYLNCIWIHIFEMSLYNSMYTNHQTNIINLNIEYITHFNHIGHNQVLVYWKISIPNRLYYLKDSMEENFLNILNKSIGWKVFLLLGSNFNFESNNIIKLLLDMDDTFHLSVWT